MRVLTLTQSGQSKIGFILPDMQLTEANIEEFQSLYERKTGKRIDKATALSKGMKLIRLIQILQMSACINPDSRLAQSLTTK